MQGHTQSYTIIHNHTQSYIAIHNHTQSYTITDWGQNINPTKWGKKIELGKPIGQKIETETRCLIWNLESVRYGKRQGTLKSDSEWRGEWRMARRTRMASIE